MVFKAGESRPKPAPVVAAKPPIMKFQQAAKIADKNSRTIVKIQQLLELTQLNGYAKSDPDGHIISRVEFLKKRLNRRLSKLAKWVDCTPEERQVEFRTHWSGNMYNPTISSATTFNKPYAQPPVGAYGQSQFQSQLQLQQQQQLQLQQQHRLQYQQALQAQQALAQQQLVAQNTTNTAAIVNNTPFVPASSANSNVKVDTSSAAPVVVEAVASAQQSTNSSVTATEAPQQV